MAGIEGEATTKRWWTAALIGAPAVLFAALAAHPFISGRLPDDEAIAEEVVAGPTRWALAHLATSVASALIILAFLVLRGYLYRVGATRFSGLGIAFVVIGSVLYAVLPGMEFAPLAVAEMGGTTAEVAAVQDEIGGWFTMVLIAGAIAYAVGVLSFAAAISMTTVGSVGLTRVVVSALVVMAVTRFVPFLAVQFYVQSVATMVALWSVAYVVWTRPLPATPASPRPQT